MKEVDDLILDCINSEFKNVKMISTEINIPYVRVSVRLRQLRKRNVVISIQSNEPNVRGVKPLKYKQRSENKNYI